MIGEDKNKKKFLPLIERLDKLGFHFYATEKTHKFLKKSKVASVMLHKMHSGGKPNLEDILKQNVLDLIINVPYNGTTTGSEKDEAVIKEWAVKNDIKLITDYQTTENLVRELEKRMVVRVKKS